jgi:hypothetical protein
MVSYISQAILHPAYTNLIQLNCTTPAGSVGGANAPCKCSCQWSIQLKLPPAQAYPPMEIVLELIRGKWMLFNTVIRCILLPLADATVFW